MQLTASDTHEYMLRPFSKLYFNNQKHSFFSQSMFNYYTSWRESWLLVDYGEIGTIDGSRYGPPYSVLTSRASLHFICLSCRWTCDWLSLVNKTESVLWHLIGRIKVVDCAKLARNCREVRVHIYHFWKHNYFQIFLRGVSTTTSIRGWHLIALPE